MIIGISGKARSGKDEVAKYLVKNHGFHRRAFADSLKDAARAIFGFNNDQVYGTKKEVVDEYWQRTPREILQLLGTECLRQGYGDDVWVRSLYKHILNTDCERWVIPDVRFISEVEGIRAWGGVIWRINRPGLVDVGIAGHASEHELDNFIDFDDMIHNDGSLEILWARIEVILKRSCSQ